MIPTKEQINLTREFGPSFMFDPFGNSQRIGFVGPYSIFTYEAFAEEHEVEDDLIDVYMANMVIDEDEAIEEIDAFDDDDGIRFPDDSEYYQRQAEFAAKTAEAMDEIQAMYPQYFADTMDENAEAEEPTVIKADEDPVVLRSSKKMYDLGHKKTNNWAPIGRVCRRGCNTKYPYKKPARSEAVKIKQIAAEQYFQDLFGDDNIVSMDDFVSSYTERRARNNRPPKPLTLREQLKIAFF